MIKINELRVGNLVYEESDLNTPFQIEDLYKYDEEEYSPIPLTNPWLLKFGFEYRNESRGLGAILDYKHHPEDTKEGYEWKFHKSVAFVKEQHGDLIYLTMLAHPTAHRILYVHQLQNSYHALTNQELCLK